jgi:hypothetical protein
MTRRHPAFWLYLESVLAVLTGVATILVVWRPDWIETLGIDPDQHSGSLEWFIALGLGAATLVLTSAAWRQRVRLRGGQT